MREMIKKVERVFAQKGYQKRLNSFYKVENGFYRLINFQKGTYGDYFFINVGVQPIGLPLLRANTLLLPNHPKESECVLRERLGKIVEGEKRAIWSRTNNWIGDDIIPYIIDAIPDIEAWLQKWGSFSTILECSYDEISKKFTVVPILWEKQYLLLKFYCSLQTGNTERTSYYFRKYHSTTIKDLNFDPIDNYLIALLTKNHISYT